MGPMEFLTLTPTVFIRGMQRLIPLCSTLIMATPATPTPTATAPMPTTTLTPTAPMLITPMPIMAKKNNFHRTCTCQNEFQSNDLQKLPATAAPYNQWQTHFCKINLLGWEKKKKKKKKKK